MTLVRRDTPPPDDEEILHRLGGVMPGKRLPAKRAPSETAIPEPAELDPVEGEVVDEQPPPIRAWSRRLPGPVQRAASGKTAQRAATTAIGMASLSGRAYDGATHGVYRRQIKAAEATGNAEALERWVTLKEEATQRRHQRLLHLPRMAFGMFGAAVAVLLAASFGSLMLAVFAPLFGHTFTGTLFFWLRLVGLGVYAAAGLLLVTMALAPSVIVAVAYREGQKAGSAAGWVTVNRPAGGVDEVIVTPAGVAEAINHLSIPALDRAVRDGWRTEFDTPPTRVNNRGYETVFSVPLGVTPDMIADKRGVLARNLHRDPMEVWPTAAAR
ncbi:MAG TPA: hypothetical protein VF506_14930, partial [Streptosporangiaceae bacterium]